MRGGVPLLININIHFIESIQEQGIQTVSQRWIAAEGRKTISAEQTATTIQPLSISALMESILCLFYQRYDMKQLFNNV